MNQPKVYISILNWNGLKDTLECLVSVFKLDYPNFEVIVVDNGSTDDSVEVIEKTYPQVTLIRNKENLGFTGGNNIAMHYAMDHLADYIWLLNNDTTVEPDTLTKLVTEAEQSSDIGLVSPVIYYYDEPEKVQFCDSYVDWVNQIIVYPEYKNRHISDIHDNFKCGENTCLWGTALLIKRNVVEKIGYLDEGYFAYWEDTDYSIRALKMGYRNVICASAKVLHKTALPDAGSLRRSAQFFYYTTRNRYILAIKFFKSRGMLSFWGNYLSFVLTNFIYCKQFNDRVASDACLDGAWAAIRRTAGPWDKTVKMPVWLRKGFLFLSSWHPHLWINLLQGKFSNISSEVLKRSKSKISANNS